MKAGIYLWGKLAQECDSFAEAEDYVERFYKGFIGVEIKPIWE